MIRFSQERVRRIAHVVRRAVQNRPARVRTENVRSGSVPQGMETLSIATWNIHSCVGNDARFAPDRVAKVIRELDVDLIGLQEIGWHHRGESGFDQFGYLADATGMTALSAPTKQNERAHYGNAILTRLPVLRQEPLDLTVGRREPRGGVDVVVAVNDIPVRVIVAHLGLDPWERARQVGFIVAMVEAEPDLPTLFMGDLNEWTRSSPRLRTLSDTFADQASPRSFHAKLPTLRLDRIYARGGLTIPAYNAVRSPATRLASDHLPVRATVAVPVAVQS